MNPTKKQKIFHSKEGMIVLLCSFFICFFLYGCGAKKNDTSTSEQTTNSNASFCEDLAGYSINLPEKIDKIISLSPSNTEILCALGVGNQIIAIDTNSSDITGLSDNLVELDIMQPDAETILSLNPDIVFTTGMSNKGGNDVFKPLKDCGICVVTIPSALSIDEIKNSILFFGSVVHKEELANEIVAQMDQEINDIKSYGETIQDKKTVYFEIASVPACYTFGNHVYLNEMLEIIGAKNIFSDHDQWFSVSQEDIISKNPDVILTNNDYQSNPVDDILNRANWENITAIKNKQVYYIDSNASARPSQNIIVALKQMADAIYNKEGNQ